MDAKMGRAGDPLTYYRQLEARPYDHDFFQAMRRIECLFAEKPRFGKALRPADEPIRLGQEASMSFAPASLSSFTQGIEGSAPRLEQRFFGLLGPNGPLPLHLTDYARERILQEGDHTFARFLDAFHHRLLLLFYRAWAQAQPTASFDRPQEDRFATYVGSLIGIGTPRLGRDALGSHAKLYYSGLLVRQVRNADGLRAWLGGFFGVPVKIEQFVAQQLVLPPQDRTRIGIDTEGARLGVGTVLGVRVWDRQHKFRIHIGSLSLAQFESFLPGGSALGKLVAAVRQYLCLELEWDLRFVLRKEEVPKIRLGQSGRLGWTTWIGHYRGAADAGDLLLNAEALFTGSRHGDDARAATLEPALAYGG